MLTNMNFTVAGWGATESAPTSEVLLDSNLNYTLNAECERKFRQRVFQFRLVMGSGSKSRVQVGFGYHFPGSGRVFGF